MTGGLLPIEIGDCLPQRLVAEGWTVERSQEIVSANRPECNRMFGMEFSSVAAKHFEEAQIKLAAKFTSTSAGKIERKLKVPGLGWVAATQAEFADGRTRPMKMVEAGSERVRDRCDVSLRGGRAPFARFERLRDIGVKAKAGIVQIGEVRAESSNPLGIKEASYFA